MSEGVDYEKLLTELLEERLNLDRMINWVEGKLRKSDQGTTPVPLKLAVGDNLRFRLATDQFFKMSVPEAIRAFLSLQKRPQTAREITDALEAGGLSHKAKDLYQTVFPTLMRMQTKDEVDKLGNGEWGLSEWYRRGNEQQDKREPDK